MNWHSGNIAEAVAESKAKDAIFVVYIEGQDEMSAKLERFVDDRRVRAKLETSDFVAIKIQGDSSAYGQFISLYKVVPIPSIFFIGKSGTPLEIATGITASVEELVGKIDKVLVLAGKRQQEDTPEDASEEPSISSSFIVQNANRTIAGADDDSKHKTDESDDSNKKAEVTEEKGEETKNKVEEKAASSATAREADAPERPGAEPSAAPAPERPIVEPTAVLTTSRTENSAAPAAAAAAEKRATAAAAAKADAVVSPPTVATTSAPARISAAAAAPNLMPTVVPLLPGVAAVPQGQVRPSTNSEVKMGEVQDTLEERKRERLAEEQRREKENELRRRREGKEAQNQQTLTKEQEIKIMQERIRRDRQEEQEARERIRAQIAADRAELTRRVLISADTNSLTTGASATAATTIGSSSLSSVDETRLQIRLPGGIHRTKSFPAGELLSTVRIYVRQELLSGSNINDFTLATSYPRREFQTEDELKTLNELNLVPNAVVLVLTKEQVNRVVRTGGSIMTMLATVVWAMLTPAAKAFDYINKMGIQRLTQRLSNMLTNMGWLKPLPQQQAAAGGDVVLVPADAASRRNMDMFVLRPTPNPGLQQPPSASPDADSKVETPTPSQKENASPQASTGLQQALGNPAASSSSTQQQQQPQPAASSVGAQSQSQQFQQRPGGYQPPRYGDANIRRLQDTKKDDKDNKATYNGNSTQQQ